MKPENSLRKGEYYVDTCALKLAQNMVEKYHYSKGGSNTACYVHGLYRKSDNFLMGVAWWLPPTRVCAESVDKNNWQKVLSLTRLVVVPDAPKNSCSFLISKSIKLIEKDGRFVSLVTYADDGQGHTGAIYRAANFTFVGKTGPYPKWVSNTGRQVAVLATKSRTKSQMLSLGHECIGKFFKYKFIKHLAKDAR